MANHLDPLGIIATAVEQTKTPYGKGYASAFGGNGISPYRVFTAEWSAWVRGRKDGQAKAVRAPSEA